MADRTRSLAALFVLLGLLSLCASCRSRQRENDRRVFSALSEIASAPNILVGPQGMARLEAALWANPAHLGLKERVVLQNDLWGSAQRLSSAGSPSMAAELCGRLAWALAPSSTELAAIDGSELPSEVRSILPESDGFVEHSSEHSVLGHERAFGLRRAFRLFVGEQRRALVSQLIAFDGSGLAHLTSILGDVERLEFDGDQLRAAQVLSLDRASGELREVETIDHIPSHGATFTIIDFSSPARVADLPCLRCHDDRQMMSLPIRGEDPTERLRRVVAAAVPPAK